jgi:hypothetical protein
VPDTGSLSGSVVDDAGRAVPEALVTLTRVGEAKEYRRVSVRADRKGRFRAHLPSGIWELRWKADGFYESAPLSGEGMVRYPSYPTLEIAPGKNSAIRLAMLPCSFLTGQVMGTDGRPVRNRRVRPVAGRQEMFVLEQAARTDARGRFRLALDYAGEDCFGLLCPDTGYAPEQRVSLEPGKTLSVRSVISHGGLGVQAEPVAVARPEARTDASGPSFFRRDIPKLPGDADPPTFPQAPDPAASYTVNGGAVGPSRDDPRGSADSPTRTRCFATGPASRSQTCSTPLRP